MFHFWLLCFLCPITVLLSFRFVDTFIPMDIYTNKSCMIGSVRISTIVHPFAWPLVYSVFSVSSGVLQNIFINSVICVTLKFGTTRSWRGATHKLKPSPFRQLQFSGPTPCSVLPLNNSPHMLSDRTIHGDVRRTGVDRKGLSFNLCVVPPHNRVVPNFRVMEFTEVFQGTPEKMEKTRGLRRWVHYGQYMNLSYHTWFIRICIHGNVCIYEKER